MTNFSNTPGGANGVAPAQNEAPQTIPNSAAEATPSQVQHAARRTDDWKLLNPSAPLWMQRHFTQSDTWRVLRIQSEFVHSFEVMSRVGPAIAIFGSARLPESSPYYAAAQETAEKLAREGWCVLTGGGPGLMEAANRGAHVVAQEKDDPTVSVGLNIQLPFEQGTNAWVETPINFRYFFCRKTNFVKYASGFVIFPGGFGTMDELFEALTLVQTGKIENFPVVLFGSDYWRGLLEWIDSTMVAHGTILPTDLNLIHLTDGIDDVVRHIEANTENLRHPVEDEAGSPTSLPTER